jgi:hypothetical protein
MKGHAMKLVVAQKERVLTAKEHQIFKRRLARNDKLPPPETPSWEAIFARIDERAKQNGQT